MSYKREQVLVVDRKKVAQFIKTNGIQPVDQKEFSQLIRKHGVFEWRDNVEEDYSRKQIIPYMIFKYKNKYFLMQRTNKGSETRLYNNYSLGIGGHINKEDWKDNDIQSWAKREFEEEVDYRSSYNSEVIGILNDDSNDVGKVHLGVIIILTGNSSDIQVKDEHKMGELLSIEEMEKYQEQMETWSKIAFEYLKSQ